jgi:hypothetical protein
MDIDAHVPDEDEDNKWQDEKSDVADTNIIPMPESGGIAALREKLHARIAALRRRDGGRQHGNVRGNANGEAGDRDELLEERRRQRAAMREKRRKETKEKIKRAEEARGKKGRDKAREKDQRDKGAQIKVRILVPLEVCKTAWINSTCLHRRNYSFLIPLHLSHPMAHKLS